MDARGGAGCALCAAGAVLIVTQAPAEPALASLADFVAAVATPGAYRPLVYAAYKRASDGSGPGAPPPHARAAAHRRAKPQTRRVHSIWPLHGCNSALLGGGVRVAGSTVRPPRSCGVCVHVLAGRRSAGRGMPRVTRATAATRRAGWPDVPKRTRPWSWQSAAVPLTALAPPYAAS